jgi:hypothetical protein
MLNQLSCKQGIQLGIKSSNNLNHFQSHRRLPVKIRDRQRETTTTSDHGVEKIRKTGQKKNKGVRERKNHGTSCSRIKLYSTQCIVAGETILEDPGILKKCYIHVDNSLPLPLRWLASWQVVSGLGYETEAP